MSCRANSGGQSSKNRLRGLPRPEPIPFLYECDVRFRRLGSSDLQVSEISLGSWLTYGVGVENDAARACLDKAFELDMNLIDTSNVYGRGAAEEFLGDALKDRPRDSYVLATKLFFPMDDTGENQGLSRQQVFKQIDDSLRRLRTDFVDLYQCHRYDQGTPLEETMDALSEIVRQGKVRYLGFSEWSPDQIEDNAAASGIELDASLLAAIDEAVADVVQVEPAAH